MTEIVEVMARAMDPVAWNAYEHAVRERGACTECEIIFRYMNSQSNARLALHALKASGRAVVPVVPTTDMIIAGASAKPLATHMNTLTAAGVWSAMLSASPVVE